MALKQYIKVEERHHLKLDQDDRFNKRNYEGLCAQLNSENLSERRWAIRDLSEYPQATSALFGLLEKEPEVSEREALFDCLQYIGGVQVIDGLLHLLHSDNAGLRNGAIEILQSKPEEVAEHIEELLTDLDSDIRIFALDILQKLAHIQIPEWLIGVVNNEQHVNVLATAVDRLAEVGTAEMVPELEALKQRFSSENFLCFAIDMAITRIQGKGD